MLGAQEMLGFALIPIFSMLVSIAIAIYLVLLLRRLVLAVERIADSVKADRRV